MGHLGALLGTFHESDLCVASRVNEVVCLFAALHISTEIHSLQKRSMRVRQAVLKLVKLLNENMLPLDLPNVANELLSPTLCPYFSS